jgi:hypothetical protein
MVQERVLKILRFFAGHVPIPFVLGRLCATVLLVRRNKPSMIKRPRLAPILAAAYNK